MLLHSLKFDIQTYSLQLDDLLNALYVSNDLTTRFPVQASVLTLYVERRDSPHALEIHPISSNDGVFAETGFCGAPCFYHDGRFYASVDGADAHEVEYDVDRHTIRVNVSERYDAQTVLTNIIRPLLQSFILPFYHLKTLHGAVVSSNGHTLILTGGGGAGKTTTALRLMLAGYTLLSDDGPFFIHDRGKAFVLSSLDYYHVTLETLRLLPQLQPHVVGGADVRGKFAIARTHLQPGGEWRHPRSVTHIIQLQRCAVETPQLIALDRNLAIAALLNDAMIVFRPAVIRTDRRRFSHYSARIFDIITAVLRDAELLRLDFADHHLDTLPSFLESALLNTGAVCAH
jgi:hypothetical protein